MGNFIHSMRLFYKRQLGKTSFISNCFFNSKKTKQIKSELTKLDFVISDFSVEDYPTIFASCDFTRR